MTLDSPNEFPYDDESRHTAGLRWPRWIQAFEYFLVASAITDKTQKKAMLLHVVGPEVREIYETLQETADDYEAIKKVLDKYFKPMKNIDFNVYSFMLIKQNTLESVDDFVVRLRATSKLCEFGDAAAIEKEIRRQLIFGCNSTSLKEYVFKNPNKSL